MSMLHCIRTRAAGLARLHLALFALVWLSIVAAPCAMAMQLDAAVDHAHSCPHCPPKPCHEVQPDDCDEPDSLDSLRLAESSAQSLAPPVSTPPAAADARRTHHAVAYVGAPPVRDGPRAHLINAQFNE
ncbi:MAG: hypothetical protein RQ729_02540 [Wenzhouxiangellaceae bacterium]|nr:hypothetical protein [Wenzhouxiangellaceae bacterium]